MKASIATVCISGSLREKLSAIARSGFDGYELFENDFVTSTLSAEEVRLRSADLGLTLDLYQPFRDIEGTDAPTFQVALERARRKFALMNRLGAELMLVCSNVGTATVDDDDHAAGQLAALADVAAGHGIRLAYEALAWGRNVSTYDHAWRIVESADHPALGLCLDSFHILSRGTDLEAIASIPADKLMFCQLADAPAMQLDVLSWSRHHRLFPGEGDWNLADFVARVLSAGYTGPLSLEVFNDAFRQGDPSVTARDARRSLLLLEDAVRTEPALAPAVADVVQLERIPGAEEIEGVDFIELLPGEGDAVSELLGLLGFSFRGTHRRKNVGLWQQGDVRVVVNDERLDRDARLAGVGLAVADPRRAAARAAGLRVPRIGRDEESGEGPLVLFAAPDGTEFSFSSLHGDGDDWPTEFVGGAAPGDVDGVGITHVDHVALAQPWQRVDEATLFFRAVLGLALDEGQDLQSQTGIVRSRSLVSPGRRIRLAVNVVPTTEAPPGSSYPNHVALAVDDLIPAAEVLIGRGLDLLAVSRNYYDDLAARFDLDGTFVETLRSARVLYDRDARGEFLHAYTPPIGDVAIELVQRIGGYDGYGAANASARLAAMRPERHAVARTPNPLHPTLTRNHTHRVS
jgi:4-hydroxyphenylpyruvate dioxygenase